MPRSRAINTYEQHRAVERLSQRYSGTTSVYAFAAGHNLIGAVKIHVIVSSTLLLNSPIFRRNLRRQRGCCFRNHAPTLSDKRNEINRQKLH